MAESGTTTRTIDDMDLSVLAEQELDEIYKGAPDRFSDPGPESPVITEPDVESPVNLDADERVLLVNIEHTEETVFIPDGNRWSGETAQFVNGRYIADRDTANKILAACPHVYEEPKTGEWLVHDESGFQTRNPVKFARYAVLWADNR